MERDKAAPVSLRPGSAFWKNFPWSVYWLLDERMRVRLDRLWNPYFSIGGLVWPSVYIVGALLFTDYTPNPLMWISFNGVCLHIYGPLSIGCKPVYDHFWDLLIISALAWALLWYFVKRSGQGFTKKAMLSFAIIATWGSWLMWSQHEGLWWVVNLFFDPKGYLLLFGYGALLTWTTFFIFYQFGYVPWRSFLWVALFYAAWALSGFHVTINTEGPTQFLTDPQTFAWEIGSWAWAAWGFWYFEKDRLLAWFDGARLSIHVKQIPM